MSDLFWVGETSELTKKKNTIKKTPYYSRKSEKTDKTVQGKSGPTPVARGGSGAIATPLAARPTLTPCHRHSCWCRAEMQVGVFGSTGFFELVNDNRYSSDAV